MAPASRTLFDHGTAAGVAQALQDRLLAGIGLLTEAEADRLLAEGQGVAPHAGAGTAAHAGAPASPPTSAPVPPLTSPPTPLL